MPGKRARRALGVPRVADRALQRSTAQVLSALYGEGFLSCSLEEKRFQSSRFAVNNTEPLRNKQVRRQQGGFMIFSKFSRRTVVSAILLMAMISPATTVRATPLTKQDVPLKVSLELHEQVGFRPDCPSQFGGTTTGTGKGTHLGKVSFNATDCITPAEGYFTFEGEFILAAANGDKLAGNYDGSFIPIDIGPTYRLLNATMEITGGTGRFAEATGSAELTGTQDITTGDGAFAAEGTMSNLGRGSFNKAPTGAAFHNPAVVNEYLAMFRNFAAVDSWEETPRQPALVVGSVSGSNVALVPEPAVLVLLGTGLAALRFAQHKKKY